MAKAIHPTDAEIAAAMARGVHAQNQEPRAEAVTFDHETRMLRVTLPGSVVVAFGLEHVPELEGASVAQLESLVIGPARDSIEQDELDVHISLGGLLLNLLGASGWKAAIRKELGRESARITSEARSIAARENGKKGGRPRKSDSIAGPIAPTPASGDTADWSKGGRTRSRRTGSTRRGSLEVIAAFSELQGGSIDETYPPSVGGR